MERDSPARYLSTASKAKRKGKIYVDYLRNSWGATSVAAYSARSRPGAPVSAPLAWNELATFDPQRPITVQTMPDRLAKHGNPWADLTSIKQQLPAELLKRMARP